MYSSESSRKNWISGDAFQLVAESVAKQAAQRAGMLSERSHDLFVPVEREDADIDFGIGEIGRNAHGRDRDERPRRHLRHLALEDFGHVFLNLLSTFCCLVLLLSIFLFYWYGYHRVLNIFF